MSPCSRRASGHTGVMGRNSGMGSGGRQGFTGVWWRWWTLSSLKEAEMEELQCARSTTQCVVGFGITLGPNIHS